MCPAQHEFAPVFEYTSVAVDHQNLLMTVMKEKVPTAPGGRNEAQQSHRCVKRLGIDCVEPQTPLMMGLRLYTGECSVHKSVWVPCPLPLIAELPGQLPRLA